MLSAGPTAIPTLVAAVGMAGRMLAPLAREARLSILSWLALRGTQPDQRPEIIRALAGHSPKAKTMMLPGNGVLVGDNAHSPQ